MLTPRLVIVAACLLPALAACSSDDDGDPASTKVGGDLDCTTALTATYPDGTTVDLDGGTAAVRLGGGSGYTVYAGDYELPTAGIGTATLRPPAGDHLASIFIAPVNQGQAVPIDPGTEVKAGNPEGSLALGVILYSGKTGTGTASGVGGTATFEGVDAERLCLSIDYRDDATSLTGTVAADVYESPF